MKQSIDLLIDRSLRFARDDKLLLIKQCNYFKSIIFFVSKTTSLKFVKVNS